MTMKFKVVSLDKRPDLFESQDKIGSEVWPKFMLHDSVAITYWMQLIEAFKEYQLMIMDGNEMLSVINTVPLYFDKSINELPDEGADWGVKKSISDYKAGIKPNVLMGVQVAVNKKWQGRGLSSLSVREMSSLALKKELNRLIIPLRPSDKHKYPLIALENYINWKTDNNLPFDNWLRVHIKAGGKIISISSKSMYIPGTIDEWKEWTKLDFPGSGSYIIPGALNPISIDTEKNEGIYIEPNIWVLHELKNV